MRGGGGPRSPRGRPAFRRHAGLSSPRVSSPFARFYPAHPRSPTLDTIASSGGIWGRTGPARPPLNVIGGSLRADRGHVLFEGWAITRLPGHEHCRAGIARTFQIPRPFAGLTAFESVLVGATYGRAEEGRERPAGLRRGARPGGAAREGERPRRAAHAARAETARAREGACHQAESASSRRDARAHRNGERLADILLDEQARSRPSPGGRARGKPATSSSSSRCSPSLGQQAFIGIGAYSLASP